MTSEEVWATEGPDYNDPADMRMYHDWLLDNNKDAEAAAVRWMERTQRAPKCVLPQRVGGRWWIDLYQREPTTRLDRPAPDEDAGRPAWYWQWASLKGDNLIRFPWHIPFFILTFAAGKSPRPGGLFRYKSRHAAHLAVQAGVRAATQYASLDSIIRTHLGGE